LEVIPALEALGGGGGGVIELLIPETGDPQAAQKAAPSAMIDPHLVHAAIISPFHH
jgi:hypothetical protein